MVALANHGAERTRATMALAKNENNDLIVFRWERSDHDSHIERGRHPAKGHEE